VLLNRSNFVGLVVEALETLRHNMIIVISFLAVCSAVPIEITQTK